MAGRKKDDDGLTIPAHLRRVRTEESRAAVDRAVARMLSREIDWVMPDRTRHAEEDEMGKARRQQAGGAAADETPKTAELSVAFECKDSKLPVEVAVAHYGGNTENRRFKNAQEFMDWFDPALFVLEGTVADEAGTMAQVREKPPTAPEPKAEAVVPPPKKAVGRGKVVKPAKAAAPVAPPPAERKPRGHGFTRHVCVVNGKTYGSVYKAFVDLGLPIDKHVKFRSEVKASKDLSGVFEHKGKKVTFKLEEAK